MQCQTVPTGLLNDSLTDRMVYILQCLVCATIRGIYLVTSSEPQALQLFERGGSLHSGGAEPDQPFCPFREAVLLFVSGALQSRSFVDVLSFIRGSTVATHEGMHAGGKLSDPTHQVYIYELVKLG